MANASIIQATVQRVLLLFLLSGLTVLCGCGTEKPAEASEQEGIEEAEEAEVTLVELEIGEYRFRNYDPTASTTTKFTFRLVGLVDETEKEAFETILQQRTIRLRDRILITARESSLAELEDPQLNVFLKRLHREINITLDSKFITQLLVSDYWVQTQ